MNRSVAIAYALASAAIAIAVVVVIGTTIGFDRSAPTAAPTVELAPTMLPAGPGSVASVPLTADAEAPLVVYQDEPAAARGYEAEEEEEREEHRGSWASTVRSWAGEAGERGERGERDDD